MYFCIVNKAFIKKKPFDGLASHPGGSSNTPSDFMLQKPKLSADNYMGQLSYFKGLYFYLHKLSSLLESNFSLRSLFFLPSEYIKILHANGTEIFNHEGCRSFLPSGTFLEVPIGIAKHIKVEMFLEYRWSTIKIQYDILSRGLDSGLQLK